MKPELEDRYAHIIAKLLRPRLEQGGNTVMLTPFADASILEGGFSLPFTEEDMEDGYFITATNGVKRAIMMRHFADGYYEDNVFLGGLIPCEGSPLSLAVLMPKDTHNDLLFWANAVNFSRIRRKMKGVQTQLIIPAHDMEAGTLLQMTGEQVREMEELKEEMDAYLASGEQEDEEQECQADAGEGDTVEIVFNRPFFFAVIDDELGLPALIGVVNEAFDPEHDELPEEFGFED